MGGVHGGLEELLGIHFAQALEALDLDAALPHLLDGGEDLGDGEQGTPLLALALALQELEEGLVLRRVVLDGEPTLGEA